MSGPWKPKNFQGQSLAGQIADTNRERAAEEASSSYSEVRYQPIAPYGGVPYNHNSSERRRIGRACDECRRKKIKCYTTEVSGSCKNCIAYQKGCTYNTNVKKRGPPRGYIGVLENRLKRIEGLIDGMSNHQDPQQTSNSSSSPATGHSSSDDDYSYKDDNTVKKKQKLEDLSVMKLYPEAKVMFDAIKETHLTSEGRFVSGGSVGYILSRKMRLMIDQSELNRYGVDIQHNENSDYFHIKKMGTSDDRRSDQIAQLIDLGVIRTKEAIKNIDDWIWRVAGIDKALSDRLLKVYFAYIHPLLPVINKVAFLEEYRSIRSCFPAGPLLNAVYGASVRYIENCKKFGDSTRLEEGEPWELPENLSEMLFQNLIIFIKGKYAPCLSSIQAIVIAHNHSANVESWTSGWLLNCIAVRMSQDIGLHRSSEGWKISQQEKETRRMVWWSVVLLDKWFSAGTGRPLTAFEEDCDELYPSENVRLDEIMDTMTETDQHLPRFPSLDKRVAAKATDSYIPMNQPFLHLLKLSEILGRILQGLYTPKAKNHSAEHGSDAIVAYLDDALSTWRASLPPLLEISSAGKRSLLAEDHVPLLSMSGLICLSYCTSLILLYRPFIEKDDTATTDSNTDTDSNKKNKLSSQSALTICTSAAIRIIEVSESMHYRDFLMVSWGFALYPVFTAALIHIYNSSNPDTIVSDVAKSNLVRALAVVDKLCLLSPMAASMGNILKKVIALSSIFLDDPDFVTMVNIRKDSLSDDISKQDISTTISPEGEAQKEAASRANISLSSTAPTINTIDSTKSTSYGGSSNSNGKVPQNWVPADDATVRSQWILNNEHLNKKRALDISTPSWEDENWLNQLYIPIQPNFDFKDEDNSSNRNNNTSSSVSTSDPSTAINYTTQQQYQQQYEQHTSSVDAYSIRQFGFSMMLINNSVAHQQQQTGHTMNSQNNTLQQHPINPNNQQTKQQQGRSMPLSHEQPQHSSNIDQNNANNENVVPSLSISQQQQQSTVGSNTFAPLTSPSALFEFSDFSYPFFYGTPVLNNMNIMSSTAPTSNGFTYNNNNQTSNTDNINNAAAVKDEDPSALFKHRPDNPFWGMPSSMEVDDWHAYLLPHQQQQQQQQQTLNQ